MKKSLFLILFALLSMVAFAKGKIEYTVTETLSVDDREKGLDVNNLGGDYFAFSNTLTDKKAHTALDLDINSKPGYNGSKSCVHFIFSLDPNYKDAYAGIGTNFKTDYSVMDLSQYYGIRFYAKGTGQVNIRLGTESSRKTFNDYQYPIILTPEWTNYEIPFSDFRFPGYGKQYTFKPYEIFNITINNVNVQGSRVDMYLDDIAFFKAVIKESQPKTEIAEVNKNTARKIEYSVTDIFLVDNRDKGVDLNNFGGDYFVYSNTTVEKKGNTVADLDINSKPGYNGSKSCVRFSYALDPNEKTTYAGAGTNLKADLSVMDLSQYYGVRFYAKGKGQVYLRLATESSRKTFNDYQYLLDIKPEWTLYEIPFSDFKIPDYGPRYDFKPSEIINFALANIFVTGAKADIFMDDIAFFKAEIKETQPKTVVAEVKKDTTQKSDATESGAKVITSGTTTETGQKKLSRKKLDDVMGKRIAVVGLGSQKIDSTVTNVVVDFIVNAFVNSGSVTVIDRSSIEKILKEQEFQMQDFVDNTKVMAIGKLLGAEFVVTGSLNKIDEKIYLNIKLISVKTAEIMGSSVTSAPEKSDYVDLCNDAVLKMFY